MSPHSNPDFEPADEEQPYVRLVAPKILIVDDDEDSQFLLGRALRGCGEMTIAGSGQEALESIRTQTPDLIILDCEMPGMSGLQLCDTLKADSYLADVPVVFVTNHSEPDFQVRALRRGAVDYLTKPVVPEVARARVGVHLALKRSMDELRRLTSVDSLTSLPNRRAFDGALEREWRRALREGTSLSLLMIDVDN